MWINADGGWHLCAWSDPVAAMSDGFVASLDAVIAHRGSDALLAMLEAVGDHVDDVPTSDAEHARFEGQWLPDDVLSFRFADADELRRRLITLEWRWRLDAVEVVSDYVAAARAGGSAG